MNGKAAAELVRNARIVRTLGSTFVAKVLEAGARQIERAPHSARILATWPGDTAEAALAMRFHGALHALARGGEEPALAALFGGGRIDFDAVIADALSRHDAFIATWIRQIPPTNEVGRTAAIAAALMRVHHRFGLPFELLELGASSGLNLNLDRYSHDLGGVRAGAIDSPVRIAPVWRGPAPLFAPLPVTARRGADLNPLDPRDPAARERLRAFIWPDQDARLARLDQALALAADDPPVVDRADAVDWTAARLAEPQPRGRCRAIFHSMVIQYLTPAARTRLAALIADAGARATSERPLAHIAFEWTRDRRDVRLSLTCWPGGERRDLARCHPYGDWVEWLD